MKRIRQVGRVIFRVSFVRRINIVLLIEIEPDQVSLSALFLRRHPGDVIVAAVILQHDHFTSMKEGCVDIALRIDCHALGCIGELGHDRCLELGRGRRRCSGQEPSPAN